MKLFIIFQIPDLISFAESTIPRPLTRIVPYDIISNGNPSYNLICFAGNTSTKLEWLRPPRPTAEDDYYTRRIVYCRIIMNFKKTFNTVTTINNLVCAIYAVGCASKSASPNNTKS